MPSSCAFTKANAAALSAGVVRAWFPNARPHGRSLRVGSVQGEPGNSLWICARTGRWKDHATGESGGDLISLYAAKEGLSQGEALRHLGLCTTPPRSALPPPPSPVREPAPSRALTIWPESGPIAGTPAEVYLAGRGLYAGPEMPLRYHPACPCGRERRPAMVALMTDTRTGEPCGVHRTFLAPDGRSKADCKPNKMMLGRSKGAVIRLAPDEDVTTGLGLVEGIENGLSVLAVGWAPVWVALSAGGMADFPVLDGIEALTLFADHDGPGQKAEQACAQRWHAAGREVTIRTPHALGKDWNDCLREVRP
jgi:putative DNA primase/helicase